MSISQGGHRGDSPFNAGTGPSGWHLTAVNKHMANEYAEILLEFSQEETKPALARAQRTSLLVSKCCAPHSQAQRSFNLSKIVKTKSKNPVLEPPQQCLGASTVEDEPS